MKTGAATKVVLCDGTVTDSWSREWSVECLAIHTHVRNILGMVGKVNRDKRDEYYRQLGESAGAEMEHRVRAAVAIRWEAEKNRLEAAK